jgi:hypothetical protein
MARNGGGWRIEETLMAKISAKCQAMAAKAAKKISVSIKMKRSVVRWR